MYFLFCDPVEKWGSWRNGCVSVAFVLLNHYQVLALVASANISLPDSMKGWLGAWLWTSDPMTLLAVECTGFADMEQKMYWKVSGPLYVGLVAAILYCISHVIGFVLRNHKLGWITTECAMSSVP
jgi:hypothetical protein